MPRSAGLFPESQQYEEAAPGEFGGLFVEGSQAATNTDFTTNDRYDGGATNIDVGFDLSDQGDLSYVVLCWAQGEISLETVGIGDMELRQDTGASDGTTPSAASATTGLEVREYDAGSPDASYRWMHFICRNLPFSGQECEWGLWFVEGTNITVYNVESASMIILPVGIEGTNFTGAALQPEKTFLASAGNAIPFGDGVSADTDVESTGVEYNITSAGDYLTIMCGRLDGPSGSNTQGSYRFTLEKDGADIFGVKTNTATGGAVRTGRGFQEHIRFQTPASRPRQEHLAFMVQSLPTGPHTFKIVTNKHDNATNNNERWIGESTFLIKTDQFEQFQFREDTSAKLVNNDSVFTDWNNGVTVTGDGVTQFIVGFSTTLHASGNDDGTTMQITRNGSAVNTDTFDRGNRRDSGDSAAGVGDSDSVTLPLSVMIVDTPPVGPANYRMQYRRRGGNNVIINSNDNGADGYKGTMFAASMKFPV